MSRFLSLFWLTVMLAIIGCDSKGSRDVPNSTNQEPNEAAFHEAGHVVFAWYEMDRRVKSVYIRGEIGETSFDVDRPPSDRRLWWPMAASSLAGGQAVIQLMGRIPEGTRIDKAFFDELARFIVTAQQCGVTILPAWTHQPELAAEPLTETVVQVESAYRANEVLARHEREVRLIAKELSRRGRLNHQDLVELLDSGDGLANQRD